MKAGIVIPTARDNTHLARFLASWRSEFVGHSVIVVEDKPGRTLDFPLFEVDCYSWAEIDEELGENAWIIPRRTDCIRSFGFYKAWQKNVDFIVTLDDDCVPGETEFITKHWAALNTAVGSPAWISTVEGTIPRGIPYFETSRTPACVLNHGLWSNVPDYDAITQLHGTRCELHIAVREQAIPRGSYFPMCGMNLAFKPQMTPMMYFLLMGRDWPYDRFGDIWCGIFAKRICDHLGCGITSGHPLVNHQRASNVWDNLRKEGPGYEVNETLWKVVDAVVLTQTSVANCYRELANQLTIPGEYWVTLQKAMNRWADLFVPAACLGLTGRTLSSMSVGRKS